MICDFADFAEIWAVSHCILGGFPDSAFGFGVWSCFVCELIVSVSVCGCFDGLLIRVVVV